MFDDEGEIVEDVQVQEKKTYKCDACDKKFDTEGELGKHYITCMKETANCKLCGETVHKSKKVEHMQRWRDGRRIKYFIENDIQEDLLKAFSHMKKGYDVSTHIVDKTTGETPLHFIA